MFYIERKRLQDEPVVVLWVSKRGQLHGDLIANLLIVSVSIHFIQTRVDTPFFGCKERFARSHL